MKKIIIPVLILLCVIGIAVGWHFYNRTIFNEGFVNGNTAGNLYNSGQYCEKDGIVYFSNSNDENKLYRMNPDGTDIKKLSDDSVAYINADDNYLYYVRVANGKNTDFSFLKVNTNSLCRLKRNGKGSVLILDEAPSMYAALSGNYLYYLHYDKVTATTLYRVKIDGAQKMQLEKNPYFTCSTDGQYFYYNGLSNDHNIYQYDTTNSAQQTVFRGNCWMPIVEGSIAYFMDCDNNYSLAKADLSTGEKTLLCDDRVDCYNIYGEYIYFQRSTDEPALCRMRTDGSDYTVIKTGVYTQINVTSQYVYFKDFTSGATFRVPTEGNAPAELFQP